MGVGPHRKPMAKSFRKHSAARLSALAISPPRYSLALYGSGDDPRSEQHVQRDPALDAAGQLCHRVAGPEAVADGRQETAGARPRKEFGSSVHQQQQQRQRQQLQEENPVHALRGPEPATCVRGQTQRPGEEPRQAGEQWVRDAEVAHSSECGPDAVAAAQLQQGRLQEAEQSGNAAAGRGVHPQSAADAG